MGIGVGAAVLGAGALGAAGSLGSGFLQAGAANKATNTQLAMYNQTRSDLMPYMTGGASAFSQLQNLIGLNGGNSQSMLATLQNSPGYQFALQQGQTGLDRTAAARGLLLSGGQLKDTVNYNQGMADQLYGTYYNQLMGAAGLGENAAAQTGNAATATGQGMAGSIMGGGQALAGGLAGGVNNLGGALYQYSMLNQSQLGTGPGIPGYNGPGPDPTLDESFLTSDRRLKTDIRRIGGTDSGLPIYSYRFKGSRVPQMGVMAQDVEKVAPDAVITLPSGYKAVNYRAVSQIPPLKRAA